MTLSGREVADLLAGHGLRPSRALGQHFVIDPNTVRRIARLADLHPGDRVVEIGAGLGSLTLALCETGAEVVAIEIDRHLVAPLREVVEPAGATVVHADALTLDWDALLGPPAGPGSGPGSACLAGPGPARAPGRGWSLVANLPYNVATPLVADLLDGVPAIARMLVLVQREVGERLAAGVGDRGYGAVSVKVAYWSRARLAGSVPASVFLPEPAVASVLVSLKRRPAPAVDPAKVTPEFLFALVRAGFAQRRKMLRRALAGLVEAGDFVDADVRPEARAEELDVVAWGALAASVHRRQERS